MRSGIRVVILVLLTVASLFAACPLPAQTLTPCIRQVRFNMEREIFFSSRANPRPTYTATVKQTFEQTLMDGNTISWTVEAVQARDEAGRTMRQHVEGCEADNGGQPQLRIQTTVFDPAAKTYTNWTTGPGTSALTSINHQPNPMVPPDWKDIPPHTFNPLQARDNPRGSRHSHHRRNGSHGHSNHADVPCWMGRE